MQISEELKSLYPGVEGLSVQSIGGSVMGMAYTLLCCQMKTWIELYIPVLGRCVT